MNTETTTDSYC